MNLSTGQLGNYFPVAMFSLEFRDFLKIQRNPDICQTFDLSACYEKNKNFENKTPHKCC